MKKKTTFLNPITIRPGGKDTHKYLLLEHPRVKCASGLDREQKPGPIRPLSELKPGQSGRIVLLKTSHLECARELAALGVNPGAFLTMLEVYPQHMIFRIERKKIAVDKEAIKGISVQAFDLL